MRRRATFRRSMRLLLPPACRSRGSPTSSPAAISSCSGPGRVVACAGLEVYGQSGLLRSVAVVSELRGEGLGKVLVGNLLERAHELRLDVVYLLTTTAADYFRRLGFRPVERGDLPEAFAHSPEFARICPASATTLFLRL